MKINSNYIVFIQQYLCIEILHWNFIKGRRELFFDKGLNRLHNNKVIYIPFIYKNKQIILKTYT